MNETTQQLTDFKNRTASFVDNIDRAIFISNPYINSIINNLELAIRDIKNTVTLSYRITNRNDAKLYVNVTNPSSIDKTYEYDLPNVDAVKDIIDSYKNDKIYTYYVNYHVHYAGNIVDVNQYLEANTLQIINNKFYLTLVQSVVDNVSDQLIVVAPPKIEGPTICKANEKYTYTVTAWIQTEEDSLIATLVVNFGNFKRQIFTLGNAKKVKGSFDITIDPTKYRNGDKVLLTVTAIDNEGHYNSSSLVINIKSGVLATPSINIDSGIVTSNLNSFEFESSEFLPSNAFQPKHISTCYLVTTCKITDFTDWDDYIDRVYGYKKFIDIDDTKNEIILDENGNPIEKENRDEIINNIDELHPAGFVNENEEFIKKHLVHFEEVQDKESLSVRNHKIIFDPPLELYKDYFIYIKYQDKYIGYSEWSAPRQFSTGEDLEEAIERPIISGDFGILPGENYYFDVAAKPIKGDYISYFNILFGDFIFFNDSDVQVFKLTASGNKSSFSLQIPELPAEDFGVKFIGVQAVDNLGNESFFHYQELWKSDTPPNKDFFFDVGNNHKWDISTWKLKKGYEFEPLPIDTLFIFDARGTNRWDIGQWNFESSGRSSIVPPRIVNHNESITYYKSNELDITTSKFTINGVGKDKHLSTDWKICSDIEGYDVLISHVGSPHLTSHSFTKNELKILENNRIYYLYIRYRGEKNGYSAWSPAIRIYCNNPTINTPVIINPINNSSIVKSFISDDIITIDTSEFTVTNGSDTHESTEWKLCSDTKGNKIIFSAIDNKNLTNHIFTELDSLKHGRYYLFARYKGEDFGYSEWSPRIGISYLVPTIKNPRIITPDNYAVIDERYNLVLQSSEFAVTYGEDTHVATDWKICSDKEGNNILLSEFNSKQLTNYIFTNVSMLDNNSEYYIFVRYKGEKIGYSDWSPELTFLYRVPLIDTPVITNPKPNSIVSKFSGIIITSSYFSVINGNDRHEFTDWKICSDIEGNNIVISELGSTNKTAQIFNDLSRLIDDTTYYIFARYKGEKIGYSDWSDSVPITYVIPNIATPSIVSPKPNDIVTDIDGLTIISSKFEVINSEDTHVATDWKICSDIEGNDVIIFELNSKSLTSYNINNLSFLDNGKNYYLFVRYKGSNLGYSDWSTGVLISYKVSKINTPEIKFLNNNTGIFNRFDNIIVMSSTFSITIGNYTHKSTDWKICSDITGINSIISVVDSRDLTRHTFTSEECNALVNETPYYVFARHKGSNNEYSDWSNPIILKINKEIVIVPIIETPSIEFRDYRDVYYIKDDINVVSSEFTVTNGIDLHILTEWKLCSDILGNNIIVSEVDEKNLNNHTFKTDKLSKGTYYAFVRYKGQEIGYSNWSLSISFDLEEKIIIKSEIIDGGYADTTNEEYEGILEGGYSANVPPIIECGSADSTADNIIEGGNAGSIFDDILEGGLSDIPREETFDNIIEGGNAGTLEIINSGNSDSKFDYIIENGNANTDKFDGILDGGNAGKLDENPDILDGGYSYTLSNNGLDGGNARDKDSEILDLGTSGDIKESNLIDSGNANSVFELVIDSGNAINESDIIIDGGKSK